MITLITKRFFNKTYVDHSLYATDRWLHVIALGGVHIYVIANLTYTGLPLNMTLECAVAWLALVEGQKH